MKEEDPYRVTIRLGGREATYLDGKWRSTEPALAGLLNEDLAFQERESLGSYDEAHPGLAAAYRAVRDYGAEIVHAPEDPVEVETDSEGGPRIY